MSLPPILVPHPHVEAREDLLGGSPVVIGTRVPVRRLYEWHRRGVKAESLVARYPSLGIAKVFDALSFAYDNADVVEADLDRERALMAIPIELATFADPPCDRPPEGWWCSRGRNHDGPCAARPGRGPR